MVPGNVKGINQVPNGDGLYQGYIPSKSIHAVLYHVLFKVENIFTNVYCTSTLTVTTWAPCQPCLPYGLHLHCTAWTAGKHPNPKRSSPPPPPAPPRTPITRLRLYNRSRRERRTHVDRASSLILVHSLETHHHYIQRPCLAKHASPFMPMSRSWLGSVHDHYQNALSILTGKPSSSPLASTDHRHHPPSHSQPNASTSALLWAAMPSNTLPTNRYLTRGVKTFFDNHDTSERDPIAVC